MTVKTVKSEEARNKFRDILDHTIAGNEVIVERYGKPVSIIMNYEKWNRLRRQWLAILDQRLKEMHDGDFVTQEELDNEMKRLGLVG